LLLQKGVAIAAPLATGLRKEGSRQKTDNKARLRFESYADPFIASLPSQREKGAFATAYVVEASEMRDLCRVELLHRR